MSNPDCKRTYNYSISVLEKQKTELKKAITDYEGSEIFDKDSKIYLQSIENLNDLKSSILELHELSTWI